MLAAASSALSPPPTTMTFWPRYCSGSMSRYTTLGSASPGTPSLRGVPRRPMPSSTAAGDMLLFVGFDVEHAVLFLHALDAFLVADLQAVAIAGLRPEFQQILLRGIAELHLADDGQLHRCGHDQLAARILEYRAAEGFLFDGLIRHAHFLGGERSGETRGPRAHDQHVERAGAFEPGLGDRLERLLALRQRVFDQAHAAEFACHENSRHIGFEVRLQDRNIEPAPLGAEHQA